VSSLLPHALVDAERDEKDDCNENHEDEEHNEIVADAGGHRRLVLAVVPCVAPSALALPIDANSPILALALARLSLRVRNDQVAALVELPVLSLPLPLEGAGVAGYILG